MKLHPNGVTVQSSLMSDVLVICSCFVSGVLFLVYIWLWHTLVIAQRITNKNAKS